MLYPRTFEPPVASPVSAFHSNLIYSLIGPLSAKRGAIIAGYFSTVIPLVFDLEGSLYPARFFLTI